MQELEQQYEQSNFGHLQQREHFTWDELEELRNNKKMSDEEYLIALWITYPSIWAEEFCADPRDATTRIKIRDYQRTIMDDPGRRKILRLGRQIGKSMCIGILSLWEAYLFSQSKILIVCPRQTHVNNIFKELRYFLDHDKRLQCEVVSVTKQPHEINFKNGSTIRGLTVGTAASGIRGQVARTLYVDEADYVPNAAVEAIDPVVSSFREPNVWLSSTPTGLRNAFYNKYYSRTYKPFHYKSSISPDWTPEKEAQYRAAYSIAGYVHEFDAGWGTSESSVFARWAIDEIPTKASIIESNEEILRQYTYADVAELRKSDRFKWIIMGVDWNKAKNGTRIVICGIESNYNIYLLHKEKIDATEFTQTIAVNRIINLNDAYKPDFIAVDVGYGSMQLEDLHLIGRKYPGTGLAKKLIGVETGGSIEIKDIVTGGDRTTFIKPFLVESTARFLERGMLRFPSEENLTTDTAGSSTRGSKLTLSDQMLNYEIDYYTSTDRPVYKSTEDHDLDAFMFCVYSLVTEVIKSNNLYHTLAMVKPLRMSGEKLLASLAGAKKREPNVDSPFVTVNPLPNRSLFSRNNNRTGRISRGLGFSRVSGGRTGRARQ
jgi:hypothetical protein